MIKPKEKRVAARNRAAASRFSGQTNGYVQTDPNNG